MKKMTTHLRLNCYMGYDEHPQQTMRRLGIDYQHATPQSMGDEWWFWNCENVPDPLPEHFSILQCEDPFEMIGFGLSKEEAQKIKDYESDKALSELEAKRAKEIKEQEEQQKDILNSNAFFCYTCSALEEWDCVCEDDLGFDEEEIYHDYGT